VINLLIGYARVSTTGQDLETQKEILENEGCEKLFVEKVTGTSTQQFFGCYETFKKCSRG
jgi:DNA invertase Pin-like site-specific DNA recombinase